MIFYCITVVYILPFNATFSAAGCLLHIKHVKLAIILYPIVMDIMKSGIGAHHTKTPVLFVKCVRAKLLGA